jgi:acetoin utilization deacetylase AcuC-like enzyme
LSHPACQAALAPAGHPERPERLLAIEETLMAQGLYDFLTVEPALLASREQLLRAHSAAHVEAILNPHPVPGFRKIDEDTFMHAHTADAARYAAGALVRAVELVTTGAQDRAFCSVRPPGHHATRERAMGFCFFNNVAVGALHALETRDVGRLAILDFDAHDGNGTVDILQADPRVLICSCYQEALYPFTDRSEATERLVRTPLAAGAGSQAFRNAVENEWLPAVERFRPELVLVSAGFDGHVREDISDLALGVDDYRWVTAQIVALADRHARGRIVSTLEGGYDVETLGRSVAAHVRVLMGL